MNSMLTALQITALGMGLVFGAIVLLWGLMNLLTSITRDREPAAQAAASGPAVMLAADEDLRAQAAAVAVAVALAEEQVAPHTFAEPPAATVSAWQLGMRTRQMYQKGNSIRRRAR